MDLLTDHKISPKLSFAAAAVVIAFATINFFDFYSGNAEAHLGLAQYVIRIVLLAAFLLALGISVAWLISQRLEMINQEIVSAAKAQIEDSAKSMVSDLKEASTSVGLTAHAAKAVSEILRQATADLTALRDSILSQNDWFYPYDRFARREDEICDTASKSGVNIVIISSSLKFDTHTTLLPVVTDNIRRGANYTYIIPKHTVALAEKKTSLRRLADKTIGRSDSIRFVELNQDDELFFFEYAIFYFERAHESVKDHVVTDYEAYVALDTAVKVTSVPWMLLREPTRSMLWGRINTHLNS